MAMVKFYQRNQLSNQSRVKTGVTLTCVERRYSNISSPYLCPVRQLCRLYKFETHKRLTFISFETKLSCCCFCNLLSYNCSCSCVRRLRSEIGVTFHDLAKKLSSEINLLTYHGCCCRDSNCFRQTRIYS